MQNFKEVKKKFAESGKDLIWAGSQTDGPTYFAMTVNYTRKIFMKWWTGWQLYFWRESNNFIL